MISTNSSKKVILLNEMLDNVDQQQGPRQFVSGDAYDQVASILKSARPKIQKWINDAESDDSESLDTFLQINDQINTVLGRYEAFKKGDFAFAGNPIPSELSTNAQGTSLIDFDDAPASAANASGGGIDDLTGLFATPGPPAMSNQQAFGNNNVSPPGFPTHSPIPMTTSTPPYSNANNGNGFNGLRLGGGSGSGTSSPFQGARQSATPPAAIMLPMSPTPGQSAFGTSPPMPSMFGGMGATMMGTSRPSSQPQQPQLQPQQPAQAQHQAQQQNKDPFADLAGLF
ncbi:hypothetical protein NP233_g12474 [Leucocoprinus birnbaumii]|uniref:GAT domain-containing protein n=1 Tax=Leucocoprinus birnbaumii TaxID=56174 RepID=A0AAD5VII5_9AGAR|nr:hypothetical protein NP233_g12474 [Leucocoprinus birnbaumii]